MPSELSSLLLKVARLYQVRDQDRICRYGITVNECYALSDIIRSRGLRVTELAILLSVNKSTASRIAENLERAMYIRHIPDTRHHRGKVLLATRSGRSLSAKIYADIASEHGTILSNFTPQEQRVCVRFLEQILVQKEPVGAERQGQRILEGCR